jgi:RNA polymerase sigma-70 factor, ECF subfamily
MESRITASEIQLIKQAQKGSELAFNKLFARYKEFVDNVLFSYVKDMDEAKDLTNVVFLKVHRKLSSFVDYSSFGGWLRIIANRTAIDYLRKMKEKAVELGENTGRVPAELTNSSEEGDLVNLLEYESLLKEFEKLPKKTQRIFNLFYVEDLPIEEISKVLNTPTGTIKATLSRTRRKLKNKLNV